MSRIRSVKPATFSSTTLCNASIEARYLFIGLWTEADDAGRLHDSPKKLAGALFPWDDKVTAARVDGWLNELATLECIVRYEVDGGRYIEIPKWLTHQRISHPSPSTLPPRSGNVPEDRQSEAGTVPEPLRPEVEVELEGEVEVEKEGFEPKTVSDLGARRDSVRLLGIQKIGTHLDEALR